MTRFLVAAIMTLLIGFGANSAGFSQCTPSATACQAPANATFTSYNCVTPTTFNVSGGVAVNQIVNTVYSTRMFNSLLGDTMDTQNHTFSGSPTGLPAGLTVNFGSFTPEINNRVGGCVSVTGTTTAPAGTYPVTVQVQVNFYWSGSYVLTDSLPFTFNVVVLSSPPVLQLNGTSAGCPGQSAGSITASVSAGTPPYQYNLNGGAFGGSSTFTGLAPGTYTVIVRDANLLADTATFTVVAGAGLSASFNTTNPSTCTSTDGSIAILASGGTPSYTYLWSNGSTSFLASNLAAGPHTVLVTDATGCDSTFLVTLSANTPPPTATAAHDTICGPGTTTLVATGSLSGYAWFSDAAGTQQVGSAAAYTTPSLGATDTFYVATTLGNCTSALTAVIVLVTPAPAANFNIPNPVQLGQPSTFTNTSTNAISYEWWLNGQLVAITPDFTTTFDSVGVFALALVAENGTCTDTVLQQVNVALVGAGDDFNSQVVTLYPNPTNGVIKASITGARELAVRIVGTNGQHVQAPTQVTGNQIEINLHGQAPGIYFIRFEADGKLSHLHKVVLH